MPSLQALEFGREVKRLRDFALKNAILSGLVSRHVERLSHELHDADKLSRLALAFNSCADDSCVRIVDGERIASLRCSFLDFRRQD